MHYKKMDSPIGEIIIVATQVAVCLLEFSDKKDLDKELKYLENTLGESIMPLESAHEVLEKAENELKAYFDGTLTSFETPLMTVGTDFQKEVWRALQTIPQGETCSYGSIAHMIQNPKAVRAVGLANSKNHIAIMIPCHRVIGANGKLTGYAGGLWRKKWLIEHENPESLTL